MTPPTFRPSSFFRAHGLYLRRLILTGFSILPFAFLSAQTTFEMEKTNIVVQLPDADPLVIATDSPGTSPNGWVNSTLESEETLPTGEQKMVTSFPDGGQWTLNRLTKTSENVLTVEDKWSVDQPINGLVMSIINIPYEKLDGVVISNGSEEISSGELGAVTEVKSFLGDIPVEEFTIKNLFGTSLTISFSEPGKFEVLSLPGLKKVEIRYYWPLPNKTIEDGALTWKVEANAKGK